MARTLNPFKKYFLRRSQETVDIANEISNYADQIEEGSLSINTFCNRFNAMSYKANLFASSAELTYIASEVDHLLELHYSCVSHSPAVFAKRLREIVFQHATTTN